MIREERPEDVAAVREVNEVAFGQPLEADLVDALRANGAARISLVGPDRIAGGRNQPGHRDRRDAGPGGGPRRA